MSLHESYQYYQGSLARAGCMMSAELKSRIKLPTLPPGTLALTWIIMFFEWCSHNLFIFWIQVCIFMSSICAVVPTRRALAILVTY